MILSSSMFYRNPNTKYFFSILFLCTCFASTKVSAFSGPQYIAIQMSAGYMNNPSDTQEISDQAVAKNNLPRGATTTFTSKLDSQLFNLGIAWGFKTKNNVRFEFEYSGTMFQPKLIEKDSFNPKAFDARKGERSQVGRLMLNVYFNINIPEMKRVVPYLGGGIGVAFARFEYKAKDSDTQNIPAVFRKNKISKIKSEDAGFGYQVIAGCDFYLSKAMAVYVEYKFFRSTPVEFVNTNNDWKEDFRSAITLHTVNLGFKFYIDSKKSKSR